MNSAVSVCYQLVGARGAGFLCKSEYLGAGFVAPTSTASTDESVSGSQHVHVGTYKGMLDGPGSAGAPSEGCKSAVKLKICFTIADSISDLCASPAAPGEQVVRAHDLEATQAAPGQQHLASS